MVVKEFRTSMLINYMGISRLTVHAKKIEYYKLKKRFREAKNSYTGDGDFSHSRYKGHGHSEFQQRISNQGSSNAPSKFNKVMVSNSNSWRELWCILIIYFHLF